MCVCVAIKGLKVRSLIRFQADPVQTGFHIRHSVMGVLTACHVRVPPAHVNTSFLTLSSYNVFFPSSSGRVHSLRSVSLYLSHTQTHTVIRTWGCVMAGSIAVLFLQDHLASEADALTATTSLGHYHSLAFSYSHPPSLFSQSLIHSFLLALCPFYSSHH